MHSDLTLILVSCGKEAHSLLKTRSVDPHHQCRSDTNNYVQPVNFPDVGLINPPPASAKGCCCVRTGIFVSKVEGPVCVGKD